MLTIENRMLRLTLVVIVVLSPALARADGGVVRASEQRGPWTITVFTSPTPPRVGTVEVSVLVQETSTGRPVLDVPVTIARSGGKRITAGEHGPNKLLQSAALDVMRAGSCGVTVDVDGQTVRFAMDVAEPLPAWWTMGPWIAWPAVVIGGFALHRLLAKRRSP